MMRDGKRAALRSLAVLAVAALAACSDDGAGPKPTVTKEVDFAAGAQDWTARWVNYPAGQEAFYELDAAVRPLPAPLDVGRTAYMLSGDNHSDDLGMVLSGRFSGLRAGAPYHVRVSVEFATNAPAGCAGIGGPPGEGVGFFAFASTEETQTGLTPSGYVEPLLPGGVLSHWPLPGSLALGNVASSQSCGSPTQFTYEMKTLPGQDAAAAGQPVRASDDGTVWLWVGTRSGFEGATTVYVTRIVARFTED